jgi:hypothetical protein
VNAIWSNADNPTNRVIEKLDSIGEYNKWFLLARGLFFWPVNFYYLRLWNGNELRTPNINDVIGECLFEKDERQRVKEK